MSDDGIEELMVITANDGTNKWTLIKKLGFGGFGALWLAEDSKTSKRVAVKFERKDVPIPQLPIEYGNYRNLTPHVTIPKIYALDEVPGTNYHFLVMQLLGRSLKNRVDECNGKFSANTTIQVAVKLLNCIQHVHNKGMIHRDIKPDNFMFGHPQDDMQKKLFTIDLGLSKYWKQLNGNHIKREAKQFILGTKPYMSINAHEGFTQSRRDDLESIGYMLFQFLNGGLPWDGLKKHKEDGTIDELGTHKILAEKKRNIRISELLGESNPVIFGHYLKQVKSLRFEEAPNYKELKAMFVNYGKKVGLTFKNGGTFDWEMRGAGSDSEVNERSVSSSNGVTTTGRTNKNV
jgi:serine/threonine protein kinase